MQSTEHTWEDCCTISVVVHLRVKSWSFHTSSSQSLLFITKEEEHPGRSEMSRNTIKVMNEHMEDQTEFDWFSFKSKKQGKMPPSLYSQNVPSLWFEANKVKRIIAIKTPQT